MGPEGPHFQGSRVRLTLSDQWDTLWVASGNMATRVPMRVSGFVRDLSVLRQVKACPEGRMASQGDGIKTCKRESIGRSLHLSGRKTQTPESHLSWNRLLVIDSSGLASRQGKRRAAQWPEPPTGVHLHQSDTPNSLRCAPWGHRAFATALRPPWPCGKQTEPRGPD